MINFIQSNMTGEGRVGRKTYWQVVALYFGLILILGVISKLTPGVDIIFNNINNGIFGVTEITTIIFLVFVSFTLLILNIYTTVRRLHDRDMTGWWIFLGIIPYFENSLLNCNCISIVSNAKNSKKSIF